MSSSTFNHNRVFGLDLLRATAILLVVLGHGAFFLNNTRFEGFPYLRTIDGVDLFFVLSGFLIGGILLKEINGPRQFGGRALLHFWKRRWFRTLPAYYLVLFINYLFVRNQVITEDINQYNWKFWVFMQNFSSPFYGFFWESWSLSIEEWFYLLSPLMLIALLGFMKPKKAFVLTTVLMLLVPVVCRWFMRNPGIDDFWFDVGFRKVVITRLDSIAYGLMAAWVFYYFNTLWNRYKYLCLGVGVALMAFVMNYQTPPGSFYKQVVLFSLTPLSCVLLLPVASSWKVAKGWLAKSITWISKISYSIYLVNLGLVAEVMATRFPPQGGSDGLIKYGLYWMIVFAVSSLLYLCFEKPVMDLRDKKFF